MILPFYPYEISINHQFPFSIPQVFSPSCKSYSYLTPSCTETWLDHRVRGQVPPDWSPGVLSQTLKHHETFPENHWLRLGWKRDSYFGPVQSPKVSATSMPGSLLRAYESPPFDTKTPRVSSIFGIPGDSGRTKGTAETAGAPPHEFSPEKTNDSGRFRFCPPKKSLWSVWGIDIFDMSWLGWYKIDPQLSATWNPLPSRRHVCLFQHPGLSPTAAAEYQSHGALQSTGTTEEPGAPTLGGAHRIHIHRC